MTGTDPVTGRGGEPLLARHKVPHVDGTLVKGATDDTGRCPECGTQARVTGKGFMGAHSVLNQGTPASPALVESNVDPADMGARVGDPEAAGQRRLIEIDGAFGRGTVEVKALDSETGKSKMVAVPATEENLRKALAYWVAKRPRKQEAKDTQSKMILDLNRQIKAAIKGPDALRASWSPEGKAVSRIAGRTDKPTSQALPGIALVAGKDMTGAVPKDRPEGTKPVGNTMSGPIGRERSDRTITDVPMAGDVVKDGRITGHWGFKTHAEVKAMGTAAKRRYWVAVKRNRDTNTPVTPLRERHSMPKRYSHIDAVWQQAFGKA